MAVAAGNIALIVKDGYVVYKVSGNKYSTDRKF
jgi:hypothetical protein